MLATVYSKNHGAGVFHFKKKTQWATATVPYKSQFFYLESSHPSYFTSAIYFGSGTSLVWFLLEPRIYERMRHVYSSQQVSCSTQIISDITEDFTGLEYQHHFHMPNDLVKSYFRII